MKGDSIKLMVKRVIELVTGENQSETRQHYSYYFIAQFTDAASEAVDLPQAVHFGEGARYNRHL